MYSLCKTTQNESWSCCFVTWQKRYATLTVWNWSVKTSFPGLSFSFLTFFRPNFVSSILAAFHSTKYSGLKFRVFDATWNSIFWLVGLTLPRSSGSKFHVSLQKKIRTISGLSGGSTFSCHAHMFS